MNKNYLRTYINLSGDKYWLQYGEITKIIEINHNDKNRYNRTFSFRCETKEKKEPSYFDGGLLSDYDVFVKKHFNREAKLKRVLGL